MRRFTLLLACLTLPAAVAFAEVPFQFTTVAVRAPDDPEVSGLRLSLLHGRNARTRGVDFGILSLSEGGSLTGVAFVGGVHKLEGDMDGGAAFSIVNHHGGRDRGLNHAFVNLLTNPDRALNIAYLNVSHGSTLVDLGGINVSDAASAQIGFLNITGRLRGFQFGFLNMAENGFLPVFPVVNFPLQRDR